jgi:hypothetical protein
MRGVAKRQVTGRAAAVALAVVLGACAVPEPPAGRSPEQAALQLFELGALDEPTDEQLLACFGALPGNSDRAELLDALSTLAPADSPQVARVEPLEGLGLTVIDLTAELPAGGLARYSVQVAPEDDGRWKVRWFGGPDAEWPRQRSPRGSGLTTSPPPTNGP